MELIFVSDQLASTMFNSDDLMTCLQQIRSLNPAAKVMLTVDTRYTLDTFLLLSTLFYVNFQLYNHADIQPLYKVIHSKSLKYFYKNIYSGNDTTCIQTQKFRVGSFT